MIIPENTSRNTHNVAEKLLLGKGRPSRVLDIPCGAGAFTKRLADAGVEVYPADIENLLRFENALFRKADMNEALPYGDGFFDALACIDGIEHLERPFDFLDECRRVLRPGGSLVISTPNISSIRSRARWLMTGHHNKCKTPLDEENPGPLHHISMLSYHKLRYMLHSRGFSIERIATNRIKAAAWLYLPIVPAAWLATFAAYARNEKDRSQRERNRSILRESFSRPVLFGETLIVRAVAKR